MACDQLLGQWDTAYLALSHSGQGFTLGDARVPQPWPSARTWPVAVENTLQAFETQLPQPNDAHQRHPSEREWRWLRDGLELLIKDVQAGRDRLPKADTLNWLHTRVEALSAAVAQPRERWSRLTGLPVRVGVPVSGTWAEFARATLRHYRTLHHVLPAIAAALQSLLNQLYTVADVLDRLIQDVDTARQVGAPCVVVGHIAALRRALE
ncbi:hypothetical protein [Pseudomonas typographi]|uniref:hypothetical protein n=1 Tax=Pseudomonas typographi TaxID=2715964 RepID=UPI001687F05A|nr:hypothetical protein [Pseudomonas typographi]MBD1551664.1 hypothetical protein [Pseudomonas typographi]